MSKENAEFVFEDLYEAMHEAGQALMTKKGFKPLSHEALIAYLRDKEKCNPSLISKLDSYRKLRNRSVYEAENISLETVQEALKFCKELILEIKKIY